MSLLLNSGKGLEKGLWKYRKNARPSQFSWARPVYFYLGKNLCVTVFFFFFKEQKGSLVFEPNHKSSLPSSTVFSTHLHCHQWISLTHWIVHRFFFLKVFVQRFMLPLVGGNDIQCTSSVSLVRG